MTETTLNLLFDTLAEFRQWMDDKPLQLALDDAIGVVQLAVMAERNELRKEAVR